MTDIFKEGSKVKSGFFTFDKVGDKVQGTYVGISEKPDSYNPGQMQKIYELKQKNGEIALIGGKESIDRQMKHINFGQIIGFIFKSTEPSKSGGKDFKNVEVWQKEDLVDQDWMENAEEQDTEKAFSGDDAELKEVHEEGQESRIQALAKEKLGATDEDFKQKVMESSKLAFMDANYDNIIKHLEELK